MSIRAVPARAMLSAVAGCILASPGLAAPAAGAKIEGRIVIPILTGKPDLQPFAPHAGWIDAYAAGSGKGTSSRVGEDARFALDGAAAGGAAIASFDLMELPPVIVPRWAARAGDVDFLIDPDYVCMPPGYPETWDRELKQTTKNYWQTFVARSRHLYAMMTFDGPKIIWWGNKVNVTMHRDGVEGPRMDFRTFGSPVPQEGYYSANHSDHGFPAIGWRHGDLPMDPGKKYAIRMGGYNSHGGQHFDLDLFIRPDRGDGYGPGQAFRHKNPTGGDLCLLLFGSRNGQLIENQIRSAEWNVFVIKRAPSKRWGQTFLSHGASLAGLRFWATNGGPAPVTCAVRIREDGPEGRVVGATRVAPSHDTYAGNLLRTMDDWPKDAHPPRVGLPQIRYPDQPGELPGHEAYYKPPFDLFQVAYGPDEAPLTPGKTYYIELEASEPIMMWGDGDFYQEGFGWYEGQKVETETFLQHGDKRWTLMMDIVTYANPGGAPEDTAATALSLSGATGPRPGPGPDGNLIVNGGAELGDFRWWCVGGDPVIDPSTHAPAPPNHGGSRRFGISVGWVEADMYQYQEIPGIEPGATYQAGMWAAHQDGTDEGAELLWVDGAFGGREMSLAKTAPEASPGWQEYKGTFTPAQKTVTVVIRYRHTKPTNVASVHVDDVWMRKQ